MEKLLYILFDKADVNGTELRKTLCGPVVAALRQMGAERISVFASDDDVAKGSPTRASDPPIRAFVSFWLEELSARERAEDILRFQASRIAGYHVRESRPIEFDRVAGQRVLGMKQMTCIAKRQDLTQAEFVEIWQHDHAKVAIETQGTFGYVRNEILRAFGEDDAGSWSAIVEESFPIEALEDPLVFFDSKSQSELSTRLNRLLESCRRFMRLDRIEVTFVSEYYFE